MCHLKKPLQSNYFSRYLVLFILGSIYFLKKRLLNKRLINKNGTFEKKKDGVLGGGCRFPWGHSVP